MHLANEVGWPGMSRKIYSIYLLLEMIAPAKNHRRPRMAPLR
jgi:hypothetical protein